MCINIGVGLYMYVYVHVRAYRFVCMCVCVYLCRSHWPCPSTAGCESAPRGSSLCAAQTATLSGGRVGARACVRMYIGECVCLCLSVCVCVSLSLSLSLCVCVCLC